jgi:DNA polymerase-3 subunit gamma/tau
MIVDALEATNANSILRGLPDDQLERMRKQAANIGAANLSRSADIAAEGLTQMRGATAPRLILELICGRMLLPGGDNSEAGLLSRIERLERVENIATSPAPAKTTAPTPPAKVEDAPKKTTAPVAEETSKETVGGGDSKEAFPEAPSQAVSVKSEKVPESPKVASENQAKPVASVKSFDIAGLRRLWPDVIENVKKRRRLTWSLLSASAQIIAVDEKLITIGIVNAGARDSFVRSESDEILRQAFIEIVGIDRKIEVVVDASIDTTSTPEARAVRKDEAPSDKNLLSGAALLAAELGATVISEKNKE